MMYVVMVLGLSPGSIFWETELYLFALHVVVGSFCKCNCCSPLLWSLGKLVFMYMTELLTRGACFWVAGVRRIFPRHVYQVSSKISQSCMHMQWAVSHMMFVRTQATLCRISVLLGSAMAVDRPGTACFRFSLSFNGLPVCVVC